jgi:hypothetical protein
MLRCGNQQGRACSGRRSRAEPYLHNRTITYREGSLSLQDVLHALQQKLQVKGSRQAPSSILDAAEEEMDQVKRLYNCLLVVGISLLEQYKNKWVQ